MYNYAYHIDKRGATLKEMEKLTALERDFYTASMLVMREENAQNNFELAKFTGQLANPLRKVGD